MTRRKRHVIIYTTRRKRHVKLKERRIMETALKKIRKEKGLTQVQVAKKAGITERNYQRIESGEQQPKVMTAMLIAQSLNIENIKDIFPL